MATTGRVGSKPRVEFDFDLQKLGQVRSALAALGDKQDAAMEAVLTEEAEDVIAAADAACAGRHRQSEGVEVRRPA